MEIELRLRDKELILPLYSFFFDNNKTVFVIAMQLKNPKDLVRIKKEIDDSETKIGYKGRNVFFETKDKIYYFQMEEDFEKFPTKKDFEICLGFVDPIDETKLIKLDYRFFNLNINVEE